MARSARSRYAGYRFPPEIIGHAVWLYFRFPLSLRMVEEMLAARGIIASHETVRQWALKFGQDFANRIRRRLPRAGDKWHLDEVAIKIARVTHSLWRAVDQTGKALGVLARHAVFLGLDQGVVDRGDDVRPLVVAVADEGPERLLADRLLQHL